MTRYAKLLFDHFLRIEQLDSAFEQAAPLLEECTSREGNFLHESQLTNVVYDCDGEKLCRYIASLNL